MGLKLSAPRYEGYGRTIEEAVLALDGRLRYHYDNVSVRVQKLETGKKRYFVWNGEREYTIFYQKSREYIRAFIYVG